MSEVLIWDKILSYAKASQRKPMPLLNPNTKASFMITQISDDYIRIDKLSIKLTKQMFLSIYDYIKEKNGWVRIGASRINTEEDTVEGLIKKEFFGNNPNGLSTATWFSAILVHSNVGIEFNDKPKGQKLQFKQQC